MKTATLPILLGMALDAKCVRGELCIGGAGCLCPDCQLKQGAKLEAATTLALEITEVKPPNALGNLDATTQAMSADAEPIQRATRAQGAQGFVRVEGSGVQHERKGKVATGNSQSQPPEVAA